MVIYRGTFGLLGCFMFFSELYRVVSVTATVFHFSSVGRYFCGESPKCFLKALLKEYGEE